ncbi:hypothetical protein GCM10023172_02070 [Hymenobacter ginsengisoli]|uniref:Uncharacterized protein n=1 Tax=Hymenobacter ginsengisoli TaxID=1051626 RepID=A0ABP8PUV3_9BACT|nr:MULTISPECIES: hypothetical protein [unclassified Hymenobacter]MBO2030310.1 hypothetical protein [Hymenobacter sp. BT559]
MLKHYSLGVLLLAAGPAVAQTPAPVPAAPAVHLPPTSFKGGAYQLKAHPDWKRAKLLYDDQTLSVSDADHKPQYALVYPADSVRAFAIGRDTFSVVHDVDMPRSVQRRRNLFVRNLYRRGGFQVAEYVSVMPSPQPPMVYTLLAQDGQVRAVLPPNNVQFRLALAKALLDYTALSQQLELDPKIIPEQLPELLAAYGRWKATSGSK